jgi:hypothetical protein
MEQLWVGISFEVFSLDTENTLLYLASQPTSIKVSLFGILSMYYSSSEIAPVMVQGVEFVIGVGNKLYKNESALSLRGYY